MKIVTAPEPYSSDYDETYDDITVFLAGGIQKTHEWQKDVIAELTKYNTDNLVVFNPRRDKFDTLSPEKVREQIYWEYDNLTRADIFSMYFCNSESDQPICMYELGRNLYRLFNVFRYNAVNHIVISIEKGYSRVFDVIVQSELAVPGIKVNYDASPKSHASKIAELYWIEKKPESRRNNEPNP